MYMYETNILHIRRYKMTVITDKKTNNPRTDRPIPTAAPNTQISMDYMALTNIGVYILTRV